MLRWWLGASLAALMMLGAGCTLPQLPDWSGLFPKDVAATELDLGAGSTITLEQISLNPLERLQAQPDRVLTINAWVANDHAAFSWDQTYQQETAASVAARDAAERATGVGEDPQVPDPVYETISLQGSLQTDALDDGTKILLPSEWHGEDVDLNGSSSTIMWLSQAQYDELASTRHTHVAIGSFDAGLQSAADAAEAVKGLIAKVSGSNDTSSVSEQDITEIEADADWGTYTLTWDGDKVRVPTIQAENKFATYTILANPDNPLILKVELKAWAYGSEALGLVSDDLKISGYQVTQISPASAGQF